MALPPNIADPKHWYERAAAMRVLAEEMKTAETKTTMLRLAADYDKLADRAPTTPWSTPPFLWVCCSIGSGPRSSARWYWSSPQP
jgi:hypothetical protein